MGFVYLVVQVHPELELSLSISSIRLYASKQVSVKSNQVTVIFIIDIPIEFIGNLECIIFKKK